MFSWINTQQLILPAFPLRLIRLFCLTRPVRRTHSLPYLWNARSSLVSPSVPNRRAGPDLSFPTVATKSVPVLFRTLKYPSEIKRIVMLIRPNKSPFRIGGLYGGQWRGAAWKLRGAPVAVEKSGQSDQNLKKFGF